MLGLSYGFLPEHNDIMVQLNTDNIHTYMHSALSLRVERNANIPSTRRLAVTQSKAICLYVRGASFNSLAAMGFLTHPWSNSGLERRACKLSKSDVTVLSLSQFSKDGLPSPGSTEYVQQYSFSQDATKHSY